MTPLDVTIADLAALIRSMTGAQRADLAAELERVPTSTAPPPPPPVIHRRPSQGRRGICQCGRTRADHGDPHHTGGIPNTCARYRSAHTHGIHPR